MKEQNGHVPVERRASEYLANERTFLAWIRTCIAIISLGFVVAKFGLWLREAAAHINPQMQATQAGASLPIGVAMMAFGGVLAVLAAWRHAVVNRSIRRGEVGGSLGLVAFVAVAIVLLAAGMIAYMLISAEHL
jgi:putative membrane protein